MTIHRFAFVYEGQEFNVAVHTDKLTGLAHRARKSAGRKAVEASGALIVTPGRIVDLAARDYADQDRASRAVTDCKHCHGRHYANLPCSARDPVAGYVAEGLGETSDGCPSDNA